MGQRAIKNKQAFSKIAGFPNVLSCVDETHIRPQRPQDNEADYVNRKGYHSLNAQMCCDASFLITSCTARWPGWSTTVGYSELLNCA
ncbi:putative nuclease HARBI1 [Lamellibrachia satsuma]|nr:putative nuclease HARBI1 [Lamellibrachia satsuma]